VLAKRVAVLVTELMRLKPRERNMPQQACKMSNVFVPASHRGVS
jgi:hypothetical protein